MTVQKIRFGLIGGGLMGREFASAAARWCHLLDAPPRPEIIAVCDPNPGVLEWFANNVPTATQLAGEYRALLANPEIDAIYCAVPHHLHEQLYLDTLHAGKHLLGEKPFGIDQQANAAILAEVAKHPELTVRCTSEFPYFPAVQRIVRYAREQAFGAILEAEAGFLHSSDINPDKPINWKRIVQYNGAYGCLGDLGMHTLHVPLRLGWQLRNVRAILSNIFPTRHDTRGEAVPCDTWDNATLLCEARSDGSLFPLTIKTQRIAPGETNTWYITIKGTRLSASFSTKRPRTLLTMPYTPGGDQAWRHEDLGYDSAYKTITGGIFEFGFTDAMQQMIAAYCDEAGRALPGASGAAGAVPFGCVTPEETRRHHALLTAALASQAQAQVMPVETD